MVCIVFAFESKKAKYNLVRKKNAYVPGKRVKTLYPPLFFLSSTATYNANG